VKPENRQVRGEFVKVSMFNFPTMPVYPQLRLSVFFARSEAQERAPWVNWNARFYVFHVKKEHTWRHANVGNVKSNRTIYYSEYRTVRQTQMSNERDFERQWTAFIFSNTYTWKELNAASGGFNNSSGLVYRDEKPFVSYVRKRGKRARVKGGGGGRGGREIAGISRPRQNKKGN